ncbi:MAG: response regulator transcription factor [Terracidiphilus sp.]
MNNAIRILLADDHPIVRKGLRSSIEEHEGIEIVGEAGDGEVALQLIRRLSPDIAVLDVDMPKMDGFAVAREIQRLGMTTKIVFLTLHTDPDFFDSAILCGGKGYLLKDGASEEIVTGLRAVNAGQMYVSQGMTHLLVKRRTTAPAAAEVSPLDSLTVSERNIMKLIAQGKSSKEIAQELNIHYRTVENHRTNICRKLEIEGANALLRFALQHNTKL